MGEKSAFSLHFFHVPWRHCARYGWSDGLYLQDAGGREHEGSASEGSTQQRLHCCGLKTPQVELAWQSWGHNTVVNPRMEGMAQMRVPASCCKGPSTCVVNGTTVVEEVWEGDCYLMGREFLENHSRVMAGTTLTVAVTMVLGGLLAVLLFRRVR